jgi:hypothetical protein
MTTSLTAWPNTRDVPPPTDHLYRSATWLLGRHPPLCRVTARIRGVVAIEDGELSLDLEHLADVLSPVTSYTAAWEDNEYRNRPPKTTMTTRPGERPGQKLTASPMAFRTSSSCPVEIAAVRLLATLATTSLVPPFGVAHTRSLDENGQRLVADWCAVVCAY